MASVSRAWVLAARAVAAGLATGASLLLGTAPAVAAGAPPAPAPAQQAQGDQPAPSGQVQALRDQVVEVGAEEAALLDQIDASNARRSLLDSRLTELGARITLASADLALAQAKLDELEARVADTERRAAQAKAELVRRAVAAYTGGSPENHYADLLLRVRTVRELNDTRGYVDAVIHEQSVTVHRYRRLHDQAQRDRAAARVQRDRTAAVKAALEADRRTSEDLRQQVGHELTTASSILALLHSRQGYYQAEIAALQRQSEDLASALRQRQSSEPVLATGTGRLAEPLPGSRVSSPFGPRVDPIFGDVRFHTGVDLAAPMSTPIHAADDGVVVSAGPMGGYGNATVLDHGHLIATLYAHQSLIIVNPGDRVVRGQVIGFVGCTGLCTGPHLHFEVRVDGTPIDPLPWIRPPV